jgi:integrase
MTLDTSFPIPQPSINPNTRIHSKFGEQLQTRSPETSVIYARRAQTFLRNIEKLLPPDTPIGPHEMFVWLERKMPTIQYGTLRSYKATIISWIETNAENGMYDKNESINAISKIKALHHNRDMCVVKRDSSAKSVSLFNMNRMLSSLEKETRRNTGYALKCAALMFHATIFCGMRPIEWMTARIEKDGDTGNIILIIKNAKNSNGRACAEYRRIGFNAGKQSVIITQAVDYVQSILHAGIEPKTLMGSVRQTILRANIKSSTGKRITLYSARHQFSANIKNLFPPEIVAVFMGHISPVTVQESYGKRKHGHLAFKESRTLIEEFKPEIRLLGVDNK